MDSWANVWLIHSRDKTADYPHSLSLAHGKCPCRRDVGQKGIPRCFVPWETSDTADNIDLFPEGFLWERGCKLERGDEHILITPKNNKFIISQWGTLPYLSKDDIQKILGDLPEGAVAGRSGRPAESPTAARASRVSQKDLKLQLNHLTVDHGKHKVQKIQQKYKFLPDLYYGGDRSKIIIPEKFNENLKEFTSPVQLWETCSGTSALSTTARDSKVSHLPPIDYRFGWDLGRLSDQLMILHTLLFVGVGTFFTSPNCAPWGNHTRNLPPDVLQANRKFEEPCLMFLAVCCFLMGEGLQIRAG